MAPVPEGDGLARHAIYVGLSYVTYAALHRAVRSRSVDRTEVAL